MIYDCIIFNNELELLELRVNELYNCREAVTHVLVESKYTFTGKEKKLHYADVNERFKDYPIVSISLDKEIDGTPWDREKFQRNSIMGGLKLLCPSDKAIVIISDADEIPSHKAVDSFKREDKFASLMMNKYGYYLDCLEGSQSWNRARIMTYDYLKDKTPEEVRNSGYDTVIPHGGWHWSWLGGVDRVIDKFNSFSHQELNIDKFTNREKLIKKLETGQSLWTDREDDKWRFVDIDNSYPEYLLHNIDKFKHLIHGIR